MYSTKVKATILLLLALALTRGIAQWFVRWADPSYRFWKGEIDGI